MRMSLRLMAGLVLPAMAWADGPSDLRACLERLHGHAPVKVSVAYTNWEEATPCFKPVASQGSFQVQVGEDGSGLHEDWNLPQVAAAGQELRQARRDPKLMTPVQDAMAELDARRLDDLLNQAEVLTQLLEGSRFKRESNGLYEGKRARVLVFTFNPTIRPELQSHVTHMEATFRVWMTEDGHPMASETLTDYSGKHTRLYGRFHNRSLVKTTYTILDQRLVAATQTLEELAYDTGKKIASRKTLNIAGEAASS